MGNDPQHSATINNVELFRASQCDGWFLGPDLHVQIDVEGPFSILAGDYFVLCSDGLTNHVTDSEIGQIVASLPPAESSRLLINLANCRGGQQTIRRSSSWASTAIRQRSTKIRMISLRHPHLTQRRISRCGLLQRCRRSCLPLRQSCASWPESCWESSTGFFRPHS